MEMCLLNVGGDGEHNGVGLMQISKISKVKSQTQKYLFTLDTYVELKSSSSNHMLKHERFYIG